MSIAAQLRRLETPAPCLLAQRLLIALPFVDFFSLVVAAVMLLSLPSLNETRKLTLVIALIASHAVLYAWRATASFAWSADQAAFPTLNRMLRTNTSNRSTITADTILVGVYGLFFLRLVVVTNLLAIAPARSSFCSFLLSWAPSLLVPQLWVFGGLRHALGGLLSRLRAFRKQRGMMAVVFRGIAFLWPSVAFFGFSILITRMPTVGRMAVIVAAVSMLVFLLVGGTRLCLSFYRRLRDRWRLWRLRLRTPSSISAAEFVSLVLSFATPTRSISVLYALRSSRVFAQSPQATPALFDLALSLEYSRWDTAQLAEKRTQPRAVGGEPWWRLLLPWPLGQLNVHLNYVWPTFRSSEFTSWIRETGSDKARKKMQNLGADFLDELGRGLEQAKMPEVVTAVGVLETVT